MAEEIGQKSRKLKAGKQLKYQCFMGWLYQFKQNAPEKKPKVLLNPTIKHAERI